MANKTDQEAAEAYRARLKRQRADQAKLRARNKEKRRPERDDVAGAALRYLLTSMVAHPDQAPGWTSTLARDLARLKVPFDPAETTAVLEAMLERHREGMERAAREREAEQGREA